jgi:AcrR family transcriptional regulator
MKSRRRRAYRSSLRSEQTEQTRERILEALVRTVARGVAELSIPAVAREAGVSVPTVYRHFKTKRDLVQSLNAYVAQKTGFENDRVPRDMDELDAFVHEGFARHERMDATVRAAMASELGKRFRREGMPIRISAADRFLGVAAPWLRPADREKLRQVVALFFSSATYRGFKDYLGIDTDEAADYVTWMVRTLLAGLRPSEGTEK